MTNLHIITADERLDKIAADFVEHCATRWQSGKSLLVCIDKITCAIERNRPAVAQWQKVQLGPFVPCSKQT